MRRFSVFRFLTFAAISGLKDEAIPHYIPQVMLLADVNTMSGPAGHLTRKTPGSVHERYC